MHYLTRAGIGEFLSNKASEALMGRGITGVLADTFTQTKQERQDGREQQKYGKFAGGGPKKQSRLASNYYGQAFGGFVSVNGTDNSKITEAQINAERARRGGGMTKNDLTILILNKNKVIANLEDEIFPRGGTMTKQEQTEYATYAQPFNRPDLGPKPAQGTGFKKVGLSRTGNFVASQALQSQPYSENFQFRNMFPPTFTGHML
jgi:hypothetical protein